MPNQPDTDFFAVVGRQRACRHFAPDAVPDADVDRILAAAVHAPSGENTQPWRFVVVRDPGVRRELDALSRDLWVHARAFAAPGLEPWMLAEIDASHEEGFGSAPVIIVVGCDRDANPLDVTVAPSIFPCVQNLLLAATALGYGSALTTLTTMTAPRLAAIVEFPDTIVPMAVIPIGRPRRPLAPPRRRPATEVTEHDRWTVRPDRDVRVAR